MLDQIKSMFGLGPKVDYAELLKQGATIVDVRTKAEYQNGHISGSINIPLNNLSNHYSKLDKNKPVITCCASGIRSAQGKSILQANGFKEVYNGGGWYGLQQKLK
jgi:rhodanese-related sulfurtransferase